jgi:hypothetical protein
MNKEKFYTYRFTMFFAIGIVMILIADDSRRVNRIPGGYPGPIGTAGLLVIGIALLMLSVFFMPRACRNRAKLRRNSRSRHKTLSLIELKQSAPIRTRRTRCANHTWQDRIVPMKPGESFFEYDDRRKAQLSAREDFRKW